MTPPAPTPTNVKVLVVDDDRFILKMFSNILEPKGFSVFTAENGLEGLQKALEVRPDLIFLDIMMPVMDGFETLRQIRQSSNIRHTPTIIVTAKADTATFLKAIKLGANDFIAKPFGRGDILRKMRFALQSGKGTAAKTPLPSANDSYPSTYVDPQVFQNLRISFIQKFDMMFSNMLKILNRGEHNHFRSELQVLQEACQYYDIPDAVRTISRILKNIDQKKWAEAFYHMDKLYLYFQNLTQDVDDKGVLNA